MGDVEIGASEDWCRERARQVALSFYRGMSLTPPDRRGALFAVYAWMRAADDAADDLPMPEGLALLQRIRHRSEAIFEGRWDGTGLADSEGAVEPYWRAFAAAVQRYPLRLTWFAEMLDGLEADARATPGTVRFATLSQLSTYRHQVGGIVGLACTAVWGVREGSMWGEALHLADTRGRAFQLINVLRDIGPDADCGRIYIPGSELQRFGLTPAGLAAWTNPVACGSLVRAMVRTAQGELGGTWRYERLLSPGCEAAAWALRASYLGIAQILEREPERGVRGKRARAPHWAKALIAARAVGTRPWMVNA